MSAPEEPKVKTLAKEDQAALEELERKRVQIQKEMLQASGALNSRKTNKKKAELTIEEVKDLASETVVYRAVGE
jgi:hypothetical protein